MVATLENIHQVRNWKPNLAALPPDLGRMVIKEIMTPRKFDYSKLDAECERVNRELAKIEKGEGNEERVASGN